MTVKIQLILLVISFCYGIIFYFLTKFNIFLIKNLSIFVKFLITFIFIIDMVLVYIFLVYKINSGIFHFYFLLAMIVGFILIGFNDTKIVNYCKLLGKKQRR